MLHAASRAQSGIMSNKKQSETLSSVVRTEKLTDALRVLLADVYALYVKTKSFHWHVSGPHFRDYHLLLDEQASQILSMTDEIAERGRKLGGTTIRSIGDIARRQRLTDHDGEAGATAEQMLEELRRDNLLLNGHLYEVHELCDEHDDAATASLIEVWIDQTEQRVWFLRETLQG